GVAALLAVTIVALLQSPPPPIVLAEFEALLHRAAEAERAEADDVEHWVRLHLAPLGWGKPINFLRFRVVRDVSQSSRKASETSSDAEPSGMTAIPPALVRARTTYRLDLDNPLSVASFVSWRSTLKHPNDRLTFTRDGFVQLRTAAHDP